MESLEDSVTATRELVFPDDASGRDYRSPELNVYDAEEVREELGGTETPQYGKWLQVEILDAAGGEDGFLAAPSDLRAELVESNIRPGEVFRIDSLTKTGHKESDPYRAELSFPDREADAGKQAGLTD